jgi:CheY-like chemotaxis protein
LRCSPGAIALKLAAEILHQDLILRDMTMPDLDEYEVVSFLHTQAAPVVFVMAGMSAKGDGLVLSPCAAAYLTESLHPPRPRPPS